MTCFGLLIFFQCVMPPTPIVSDFCDALRPEIHKIRVLTAAELAALQRPRKEALRNIRQLYKKFHCAE